MPIAAPKQKTKISIRFLEFKAFSMYWYCPRSNNKKEPEIPGNIIAHIAIRPDMNITIKLWFAAIGFKPTKMYERMIPIAVITISFRFRLSN